MEKSSVEITGAIDKSVNSDDSIENYLTGMRSRYSKMETKLLYTLDIRFSTLAIARVSNLSAEIFLRTKNLKNL